MVDLDSNRRSSSRSWRSGSSCDHPRGLTTFSIANDVAKYFAIIPAMFLARSRCSRAEHHGPPDAAIRHPVGVIFNALIIVALVPLALRGIRYRPEGAAAVLAATCCSMRRRRHHPFIGIKAIDVVITMLGLA